MKKIEAGEFSEWVDSFIQTMKGVGSGDVPCGDCVGCCTSSKFILVRPTDVEAKKVIPKELLFSAPGLPEGFSLLGYNEKGHCPMFQKGSCTIYSARPQTCRQYDCRVLSATKASTKAEGLVIADRIQSWEFSYSNVESESQARAVKLAMVFLRKNEKLFPNEYLPPSDSQRAAIAIRIHSEFIEYDDDATDEVSMKMIAEIVKKYSVDSR